MLATVESLNLSLLDFPVPCSGWGHYDTPKMHGDPSLPAEYMLQIVCEHCPKVILRPVCKAFTVYMAGETKRVVICTECSGRNQAWLTFTIVGPL